MTSPGTQGRYPTVMRDTVGEVEIEPESYVDAVHNLPPDGLLLGRRTGLDEAVVGPAQDHAAGTRNPMEASLFVRVRAPVRRLREADQDATDRVEPEPGSTHENRQAMCNAARQPGHLPVEDSASYGGVSIPNR